ncbi:PREDICTED: putative gustatory receptor 28b isoform X3 [Wasmannia auropunctata]|nr:PREDICTED: putative gustatory receptor 28b isoform X3 [Wasmannia auropunctata]
MFSTFIMIITHVSSGPRMRLLQTILKVSSKLPSESYQEMSKFIHVKDILGITLRVVQICTNYSKVHDFEINLWNILTVISTTYVGLLVFQINMLFINCVCVLKACFKRINENLAHVQRLMVNDIKLYKPRFICNEQRNKCLLIKLKMLEKQHLIVSNTVQMLNLIFSLQVTATIVMTYASITFELYFYIVRWQDGVFFDLDKQYLDVLITSTGFNILKIVLHVWACETGKNQAQEIGTTIHDLLNSTNDEQIKKELVLFSLQILHRENTFSVKAFTVDAKLFTAIVGNITMYLLILIQFLNMSHSCDRRTAISVTQFN